MTSGAPEVFQLPWHLHVVTHSMWDKRLMLLNLTQEWLPTTFTRHSEISFAIWFYYKTIIIQALLLIAIGLLVPQPCLISGLLRHQRKLPYWCTKVCYSHQLKPNLAYSPQGRLLRKRQDSVFERDYVSTPLHPGPQFWGGTHISRYKPST